MKILTGTITATKMNKTATISVTRFVAHPLYRKRLRRTKKYQVHDEVGHKIGEIVDFVACAPISKTKKWKIVEVGGKVEVKKEVKETKSKAKAAPKAKAAAKPKK